METKTENFRTPAFLFGLTVSHTYMLASPGKQLAKKRLRCSQKAVHLAFVLRSFKGVDEFHLCNSVPCYLGLSGNLGNVENFRGCRLAQKFWLL